MVIKDTKVCPQCGKEYPLKDFASLKQSRATYTCCLKCRKEIYIQPTNERKAIAREMPWYDWWVLKNQNVIL
jgi:hypothetical protein